MFVFDNILLIGAISNAAKQSTIATNVSATANINWETKIDQGTAFNIFPATAPDNDSTATDNATDNVINGNLVGGVGFNIGTLKKFEPIV